MVIRASRAQCSFDSSPGLIAVFHALHRLLAPRHPPHALSSLTALILSSTEEVIGHSSLVISKNRLVHAAGQGLGPNNLRICIALPYIVTSPPSLATRKDLSVFAND